MTALRSAPPTTAAVAPDTHVLVYDGDCSFCTSCARWMQRRSREPLEILAFAELDTVRGRGLLASLSSSEVRSSAHYVTPEGVEYHGGQAVTRVLRLARPRVLGWIGAALDAPGLALLRDAGYSLTSRSRGAIGWLVGLGSCSCGQAPPAQNG